MFCIFAVRAACELQIAVVKISLNANAAIFRLNINYLFVGEKYKVMQNRITQQPEYLSE